MLPPLTHLAMIRNPSRILVRTFLTSSAARSALAPTFSSTGDVAKIVSKLGPPRIATMIMTGKPNRPFPADFQVDAAEFLPGAVSAAGVVTSCMSSGDWEGLEGLVARDCINSLQSSMNAMDNVQKDLVVLNPEDVFLSFISNPEECDSGNNLHVVTFSLPKLEQVKQKVKENKEAELKGREDIKNSDAGDTIAKVKELQAKLNENDPHLPFKDNEILIGNFRFVRDSASSQWTITEVAQINSLQAWASIFKLRWKGRLGIATRGGYEFSTVLRYDYMTDYIAFSLFTVFYIFQLLGAGVITAPHM